MWTRLARPLPPVCLSSMIFGFMMSYKNILSGEMKWWIIKKVYSRGRLDVRFMKARCRSSDKTYITEKRSWAKTPNRFVLTVDYLGIALSYWNPLFYSMWNFSIRGKLKSSTWFSKQWHFAVDVSIQKQNHLADSSLIRQYLYSTAWLTPPSWHHLRTTPHFHRLKSPNSELSR